MEPEDDSSTLFTWYHALRALRVDLIGDFAGRELFAIHGDALLLHCISEAKVDFSDGFQLLHAIHAVEAFLSNLRARGCRFQIVWFRSHAQLCVPANSSDVASAFHRLTRAILIKHLRHHQLGNEITFEFQTIDSPEFQKYLTRNSLRFFLCLDAFALSGASPHAVQHVAFIRYISSRGYSVALINNFEFKSSKAFASVLPPSHGGEAFYIAKPPTRAEIPIIPLAELERRARISTAGLSPWGDGTLSSARDLLSLVGVCNVLLQDSSDAMKGCTAAYLVELSYLRRCRLLERSCSVVSLAKEQEASFQRFLSCFADICIALLETLPLQENWDVFDLLDGRILRQILKMLPNLAQSPEIIAETARFANRIHQLTVVDVSEFLPQAFAGQLALPPAKNLDQLDDRSASVMTFSHAALDKYLQSIHVVANEAEPAGTSKVFQELSHWHNAKMAVDPRKLPQTQGFFARRRNQKLMADTIAYSASLTNAGGKIINPETIVTQAACARPVKQDVNNENSGKDRLKPYRLEIRPKNKKNGGKCGRESALEEAQRIQREKLDSKARDVTAFWEKRCKEFQGEKIAEKRLAKVSAYLTGLSNDDLDAIGAEVYLYMCDILVSMIFVAEKNEDAAYEMALFAKLWSMMTETAKLPLSGDGLRMLNKLSAALKMPITTPTATNHLFKDRKLPFPSSSIVDLQLPVKPLDFQLGHCGPFLERSFDPAPDPRVPNFVPDAWQRKVLDAIDSDKSLFVVAPTSAGKTFISFSRHEAGAAVERRRHPRLRCAHQGPREPEHLRRGNGAREAVRPVAHAYLVLGDGGQGLQVAIVNQVHQLGASDGEQRRLLLGIIIALGREADA
ncbi:hypothetical protein NQ176_g9265 [Zarea fungicola]|uniref:Uncharacterized protein n=1 Tax=Zarea fungicola TaxID=93591 RepID=A0ACC1MNL7_9HYPO|nr:hypothetical protein NQ176_g9265 [Lecanicillium fungicola]